MPTSSRTTGMWGARGRAWVLFVLGTLVLLAVAPEPRARAQDAAKDGAAAAAPAVAPAPATPATGEPTAPPERRSMLRWALEASGPIGVFLLFLSVYFTAVVIRLFMELRLSEAVPPSLIEKMDVAIREKKFQELYDACRDNDSFLARLVRTGVANLPNGRAEAKEAMNVATDEIVTGLEAKISYLAIVGQLGPMIGLVGTIWGMIMSFQEIATAGGSQPRADKVAQGISTALFITLEGVSLAVPAIFFFSLFRNRIAVITMEATKVADRTIASLVQAAKQAKTP